jgi:hypothetical protein
MYSRCYAIGEYTTTVSEQRLGNHVPAETNKHVNDIQAITRQLHMTTIEELWGVVFSVVCTPELHNEDPRLAQWN